MEVRVSDVNAAREVLIRDYHQTTGLGDYDLSTAEAVFDEQAATVQCPACGTSFSPTKTTCPECGLAFGG